MRVVVRKYRIGDKDFVWRTFVAAMKQHIEDIWGWDSGWQRENFEQSLEQYQTFLLHYGGRRIGYLQARFDDESTYLNMLVLDSANQSKGIGSEILDRLQSSGSGRPLLLRCFRINGRAYAFYLKVGFKVVDSDPNFLSLRRDGH